MLVGTGIYIKRGCGCAGRPGKVSVRTHVGATLRNLELNRDQIKQPGPRSAPVVVSMRRQCWILLKNLSMQLRAR
jgi:hypothetical protein